MLKLRNNHTCFKIKLMKWFTIAKIFPKKGCFGPQYNTKEYEDALHDCEQECGRNFNGAPMEKRRCSCSCDYLGTPEECGKSGAFSFNANSISIMISFFMYKYLVN